MFDIHQEVLHLACAKKEYGVPSRPGLGTKSLRRSIGDPYFTDCAQAQCGSSAIRGSEGHE